MLRIHCPFCGVRDQEEFMAWGDASITYPALDAPVHEWLAAVYSRANQRGVVQEFYQHTLGCRRWLVVERDNLTHEVLSTKVARERVPRQPRQDRESRSGA